MHNKTRTRLWWAAIATALAMLVCGIASAQGDASALLAIVTDSAWTPAKLGPGAWYQGEYDAIDSSGN